MTRGVLIFAFNNEQVDYVSMAAWSAKNIHRHLDLPVCLVTDVDVLNESQDFEQVIKTELPTSGQTRFFKDYQAPGAWHNTTRVDAYELSPWDQTLVLDADYVVASDQLSVLFQADQDFLAHDRAYDLAGSLPFDDENSFGRYRMPMSWATVMFFRRSKKAQLIFDCMNMIRDNWNHYRQLYHISEHAYRNDHALSIAQNLVDGHGLCSRHIPWGLATVTPETRLEQVDTDTYKIQYQTSQSKMKWLSIQQDFHAMNKKDLEIIIANPC